MLKRVIFNQYPLHPEDMQNKTFHSKKTDHTSDNTNTNNWWSVNWNDSLASIISATLIKNSNWETTATTTTTTSINTQTKTQTECTTRQARKPLWSTFPFQHEPFYVLKWTKICRTSNCFVCSFFQTQSRAFPCQRVRLTVGPTSREFSHKNVGPLSKNIADFYKFLAILKTCSLPVVKNTHKRTITHTHTPTQKNVWNETKWESKRKWENKRKTTRCKDK